MVESALASRWHILWPIGLSVLLGCAYLGAGCARPRGADMKVALTNDGPVTIVVDC